MAALRQLSSSPLLHFLQPIVNAPLRPATVPSVLRQLRSPFTSSTTTSVPIAAIGGASIVLRDIWESILRAVPKKKTSHMKKRHRQMAGKALKDLTELNKCSSCGRVKRMHLLCPYCVQSIQSWFKKGSKEPTAEEMSVVEKA